MKKIKQEMNEEIRQKILDIVNNNTYIPCFYDKFYIYFESSEYKLTAVYETLDLMIENLDVELSKRGKIIPADKTDLVSGVYRSSAKSYGFVTPDCEFKKLYKSDIFIPPSKSASAIEGDRVTVRITNQKESDKSVEGVVLKIIKRAVSEIAGTYKIINKKTRKGIIKYHFVVPDSKKYSFEIKVNPKLQTSARDGDKVLCKINSYPIDDAAAKGEIIRVFGKADSKEANYEAILNAHEIITDFSQKALDEAQAVSGTPISTDGRLDLRNKKIFTIDGADAKDLDDAISVEKTASGYCLGVHIADVTNYVREKTVLDREAFDRGTSIYFTDKVIPMLPRALSNGACSLNSGTDKYTLSALIEISSTGDITSVSLHNAIISSKVRGVYSEVNDIILAYLDGDIKKSEFYSKYSCVFDGCFDDFYSLYKLLEEKSARRGSINLDTEEAKIILDENGNVSDIVKRERGDAEKLIEQFMLCANEAVANWLFDLNMPCVYRIHENPSDEKISALSVFAYNLGLNIKPLRSKTIYPSSLRTLLCEAEEKGFSRILSSVMLRSLMKAKYSAVPSAHFGLAIEKYCHFTSPIRRYPDLTVHRIVKAVLDGNVDEKSVEHLSSFAQSSAEKSSENELKALYAEREIEDLYKALYMLDKKDMEFDARISSVCSFGFFCELDNTCEGLVPVGSLKGYFDFDEKNFTLASKKKKYSLGDKVRIKVRGVDVTSHKLEFQVAE